MADLKPFRIFIGSSEENRKYATWILELINDIEKIESDNCYKVIVSGWWERGLFKPMNSFFESLHELLPVFEAAIFIGGMEDLTIKRDKKGFHPRDNIILELGLFSGAKGKYFSLLVAIDIPELPSDLSGINIVKLNSINDYNEFQNEARSQVREWLRLIKNYKEKFEKPSTPVITDNEIDVIIKEMVTDINDALKIDSPVFHQSIKTSLNLFASDVDYWSSGQLYIGPERSVQFLISLYRNAKKVFATSVKDFSTAWNDNLFGDEILKAHKESAADVVRIFWFAKESDVKDDDIGEMEKQTSFGVKVYLFFEYRSTISIPTDIARDFTIIDDEIIGITESFGRNRNAAHYYFKNSSKNKAFFTVRDRLKSESIKFEAFKSSLKK